MNRLPYRLARFLSTPFRWLIGFFHSTIRGDARWMSRREQRRLLAPRNRGLVLSPRRRLPLLESFRNLGLVAPTGSGKTAKYVIPNVLLAEGSVVVTDPSGEIFAKTSGHLKDRGFHVQTLSPADLPHSLRFNPLAYWQSPQELRQLATILAQNSSSRTSDPFWTISAINVLYLGLAALSNVEDDRFRNLPNLRWLLNHMGAQEATGMHYFMSRYLEHSDPRMFSEYLAFCAQDSKVRASVLASARAALELWSDPDVCRVTATNSVDIPALRKRRTAVYILVPEHQVRYFSILLNLFYSACFSYCLTNSGDDDMPVFFLMDEFGNLGHMTNIASTITTLRKRRCSISVILQDLSQLRSVYGPDEARTIFSGGCGNKLFFSGLDLDTTQYIEQSLGKRTEYDTTFGGIDDRASTVGVSLMTSDEIRMMKAKEGILISGRERPAKLEMPPYFRVPAWRKLTEKPPAIQTHDYAGEEVRYLDLEQNHQLAFST